MLDFKFGSYTITPINLIFFGLIIVVSIGLRRIFHRLLKRYVSQANLRIEGQRIAWLKLISQSVYIIAFYIAALSLNYNNDNVTLLNLLKTKIIHSNKFTLTLFDIITIFLIFYGARIVLNITRLYLNRKFKEKNQIDAGSEYVYMQLAKYIVYILAGIFSLKALDVKIESLLLGSAALLVGLGMGLQDVFRDMFSGIVLLFEGNVKVGDVIEIGNKNGTEPIVAKILKINIRTTQIQTRDGNVLIMPNAKLTQEYVENWSHGSELTRFIIPVTVAYGSDTELVSRLLRQAAMSHPKIKKTQPIDVRLSDFGGNGMEMELIFWADQSWDISFYKSDIRFEIDRLFREYQIKIPYQQHEIKIKQ